MTSSATDLIRATAFIGAILASLAGCNAATPPEAAGQVNSLPAMQSGPTSVGAAGLGPAGQNSAIGSGNLANPGVSGLPGAGAGLH